MRRGAKLVVMPNNVKVTVAALFRDDTETPKVLPGENPHCGSTASRRTS